MAQKHNFILGEYQRTVDERFRISIPVEMCELLTTESEDNECILAKERPGCLSLWGVDLWQEKLSAGVELLQKKMQAGKFEGRIDQLQMLGRLLSTRHKNVQLAGRGRLVLPEGFREFLAVEPGAEVVVVGAAVCVEIWKPDLWYAYLNGRIPKFKRLFEKLTQ
ncbi:MAG: division/cell wall cluster transcriptional repressor MraZ [Planctomycetia bacterium]|nr:division/cell wall cluster transcriptional repressor MraZ [Planctomycetia bacterium]